MTTLLLDEAIEDEACLRAAECHITAIIYQMRMVRKGVITRDDLMANFDEWVQEEKARYREELDRRAQSELLLLPRRAV